MTHPGTAPLTANRRDACDYKQTVQIYVALNIPSQQAAERALLHRNWGGVSGQEPDLGHRRDLSTVHGLVRAY